MNCKKILAGILSAAMVFTTMAIPAFADESETKVAEINGTGYNTLTDAIAAAGNGNTVTLLSNVTESITVEKDKNITLDLNGYKLTNTDKEHTITNYGTLTIEDSSTDKNGIVDNVSNGRAALINDEDATATLNGGTFMRSQEKGSDPYDNGTNSYYTVQNGGTMTINEGVTVENKGAYSSNIANFGKSEKKTARLTVNGGTFSGGINTLKNGEYGVLEINNGEFFNTVQYCIMNWDKANISGGEFNGSENVDSVYNGSYTYTDKDTKVDFTMIGDLTITGGTFTGAIVAVNYGGQAKADPVTSITGGTFDTNVNSYCAEGYAPKYDESTKSYTVDNNVTWEYDTDSGFYVVNDKNLGMMRFMFKANSITNVTEVGIKYISAANLGKSFDEGSVSITTDSAAVQGDIVSITEGTNGTYYAAAYLKTATNTFWSKPLACTINWNQKFENYIPQGGNK